MKTILALPLLAALLLTACQRSGGVAVVDINEIAQEMGWTDQLNTQLQDTGRELQTQFEQITKQAQAELEKAKQQVILEAKLNEEQVALLNQVVDLRDLEKLPLSQEQRNKLITTLNQVNQALQNARNQLQQALQQRQLQLIKSYQAQVQPFAEEVAREKGLDMVLLQSESILYVNAGQVDLTDEVLRRLRASLTTSDETP